MPKAIKTTKPEEEQNQPLLVGYVRKSNAGKAIKLSVNTSSFSDCGTYVTSDGQTYVQLVISLSALESVLNGTRSVTSISHMIG